MDEIKRKNMGTYDIIYHKSQLRCTERPGDDPSSARGFDMNPQQKVLTYEKGQEVDGYTVPIGFSIRKNIRIPMRDGLTLCGDLMLPAVSEKVPVVLIWTPFGKDKEFMAPPPFDKNNGTEDDKSHEADVAMEMMQMFGRTSPWNIPHGPDSMTFIEARYAVCIVDLRGACNSEGDAEYFGNGQDSDDLCDAIDYLSKQDWCNGKVATTGCSWIAMASWYAAAKHPPALACIVPFEGHSNMYRDEYMRMGVRDIGFARNYFTPGYTWQEHIRGLMEEYPVWNDFWESKHCPLEKIQVPMYVVTGWYSYYHVRGTLEAFQKAHKLTADGVAGKKTLKALEKAYQNGEKASPDLTAAPDPTPAPEEQDPDLNPKISGPSVSSIQLLSWYDVVKPSISNGQHLLVYEPSSGLSWTVRVLARGRHCDAEPLTARDTRTMVKAFGGINTWNQKGVYVQLPDGRWSVASTHDMPHESSTIKDNDFNGHLCVHFLRTMEEAKKNDPNYGVANQETIRQMWKNLTGQDVTD